MHPRQVLRQLVVELLKAKLPPEVTVRTGALPSPEQIEKGDELPAVFVHVSREPAAIRDSAQRRYERTARLAVEVVTEEELGVDPVDHADALAWLVEQTVEGKLAAAVEPLVGITLDVKATRLVETQVAWTRESRRPLCVISVQWDLAYLAEYPTADESTLHPLNAVHGSMDLQPADGTPEVEFIAKDLQA